MDIQNVNKEVGVDDNSLTLEAANFDFDTLSESPAEEAVHKLQTEEMAKIQKEYINSVLGYMEHGNMPRPFWEKLPKKLQKDYALRHRFDAGHKAGVPMTPEELASDKKKRQSIKKKKKTAKLSRKKNRSK